ncbi:hypothetical protein J7384_17780 [Endozoicomonas sp. G2_1]|uniref:hypothetical protein n=1 Tax=Endozoicomonas sp. G2_1 TaxID=2821091 RepID=UPI001ADAAAC1|nr:hypothetical protein [Endozoicomonas sp. G2_1]MBO9492216.1 hypothetical protein [Endozoicomonas sp. G2_1]
MSILHDEENFLNRVLKGNTLAVRYCIDLGQLCQLLDDVVDGDKPVTKGHIERAFWCMLIELPNNSFFIKHNQSLMAVLSTGFNAWLDSNELEKGNDHEQQLAFVLRNNIVEIVCHCAYLVGGYSWMREISPTIRRHYLSEAFSDYQASLR